ncbi:MAG: response regulator transcription factor [Spirochaetaceae bacterium]|nr:response regulator transcription factor [Spirochaetaceae bacterium]
MAKSILIVEDEVGLRNGLSDSLEAEGFEITLAENGAEGLEIARNTEFSLILLDVMLPEMDGVTVAKILREENCYTPIIMLTAKSQLDDKVTGLRSGADDYMTKPFDMEELLARIDVQIRRGEAAKKAQKVVSKKSELTVDLKRGFVVVKGEERQLYDQEIRLLDFFYKHEGEILDREQLLEAVWSYNGDPSTRTVDVHIARLRQKIGDVGDAAKYIHTIRGKGYKFTAP